MINNINKKSLVALMSMVLAGSMTFTSCDDDDNSGADPYVSYIRTTHPEQADSLLDAAPLGSVIALIGDNLDNITGIRFNDVDAKLNSSYITSNSLLVTIPQTVPNDIKNEMYITCKNGNLITLPFTATIPAPVLKGMVCEQVKPGDYAVINGNYFVNTETQDVEVTFAGNIKGEIDRAKSDYEHLYVKVPEGAKEGAVIVSSNYGVTTSNFWLNDHRNMLVDFETAFDGWGKHTKGLKEDEDGNTYLNMAGQYKNPSDWVETCTFLYAGADGQANGFVSPGDDNKEFSLKFELRVNKEWPNVAMRMVFQEPGQACNNKMGNSDDDQKEIIGYCYEPWKNGVVKPGDWVTVVIPLTSFNQYWDAKEAKEVFPMKNIGGLNVMLHTGSNSGGEDPLELDMDVDNFRIVPNN